MLLLYKTGVQFPAPTLGAVTAAAGHLGLTGTHMRVYIHIQAHK